MQIEQIFVTNNPCYKRCGNITVKGLMLHSVGVPQPKAEVLVNNYNKPDAKEVCVHAFIDGNSGMVYQVLPWKHGAWHCGKGAKGSANATHIGVEMCEPSNITYTAGAKFTCSDKYAALEVVKRTYKSAVELFAFLCKEFQLDPLKDGVIISHREGHARGIASGHEDPEHLWRGLESGYTMDGFRRDVSEAMKVAK